MEPTIIDHNEYAEIPGHEQYGINRKGIIREFDTGKPVRLIITENGYSFAVLDDFNNGDFRAVAVPWSVDPTTVLYDCVSAGNAEADILTYKDYIQDSLSGVMYNLFNSGRRKDNLPCKVRDFKTGEVFKFPSLAQAAAYMGLRKDSSFSTLFPKQYGKLIVDKYELKYEDDNTPWFYEGREHRVPPSRYLVIVRRPDGTVQEIFSTRTFLKEYSLYSAPYGKSIPNLAKYAQELYPELTFTVRDAYEEIKDRPVRYVKESKPTVVYVTKDNVTTRYESRTKCADALGISRSVIKLRLDTGTDWNGLFFTSKAPPATPLE